MEPESKKRKVLKPPPLRTSSTQSEDKDTAKSPRNNVKVTVDQTSSSNLRIQQAKNYAVAQAQQEGCTGNYRIFDSPFGNFLVPVVPNLAELGV